jgi:hypothetical protein
LVKLYARVPGESGVTVVLTDIKPEGHHNCLRLVLPATVVTAVCELLNEGVH